MVKLNEDIGTETKEQMQFLRTRVLQPTNLKNNLVNLFQMDFGHPDHMEDNRFPDEQPILDFQDDGIESFNESNDEDDKMMT